MCRPSLVFAQFLITLRAAMKEKERKEMRMRTKFRNFYWQRYDLDPIMCQRPVCTSFAVISFAMAFAVVMCMMLMPFTLLLFAFGWINHSKSRESLRNRRSTMTSATMANINIYNYYQSHYQLDKEAIYMLRCCHVAQNLLGKKSTFHYGASRRWMLWTAIQSVKILIICHPVNWWSMRTQ